MSWKDDLSDQCKTRLEEGAVETIADLMGFSTDELKTEFSCNLGDLVKLKRLMGPIPKTLHAKRARDTADDEESSDEERTPKNGVAAHLTAAEIYLRELVPSRWHAHDPLSLRTAINGLCPTKNLHILQELDFMAAIIPRMSGVDYATKVMIWGRLCVVLLKGMGQAQSCATDVYDMWTLSATKITSTEDEDLIKLFLRVKSAIEKKQKTPAASTEGTRPLTRFQRPFVYQNFRRTTAPNNKKQ